MSTTAREVERAHEAAANTLADLVDLKNYLPDIDGWRHIALSCILARFDTLDPDDPFWFALGQFAAAGQESPTEPFDVDLQAGAVALMIAADRAYIERFDAGTGSDEPYLTFRTMRELEAAHARIGAALDRIRAEA